MTKYDNPSEEEDFQPDLVQMENMIRNPANHIEGRFQDAMIENVKANGWVKDRLVAIYKLAFKGADLVEPNPIELNKFAIEELFVRLNNDWKQQPLQ
ncbi:MAG: hypothetical protein HYZ51_04920 [Candidatus Doudnabacteria bacterium]|nr:hypothetical protein [Candidatus Doudnabacteria bacterium]